jgi:signal transduction histidine kinase
VRRLRGDATALGRVVRDLLDNALRHATSRVGSGVGPSRKGARAVLVVADDGPGIPAADRERFTRLDDARSQDAGRTGLGSRSSTRSYARTAAR